MKSRWLTTVNQELCTVKVIGLCLSLWVAYYDAVEPSEDCLDITLWWNPHSARSVIGFRPMWRME